LYFCHIFLIRNARKPIKGSKDSCYSLVSNKTLSQKRWLLALAPRARWPRPKICKLTPIMMSLTKNKSKTFQLKKS